MREIELHILPIELRDVAISLSALGIDEFGWLQIYDHKIFNCLLSQEQAIIGGDVYYEYNGKLESAYANWHCEPNLGESKIDFVRRSVEYAGQYLERIKHPPEKRAIFVPVLGKVI